MMYKTLTISFLFLTIHVALVIFYFPIQFSDSADPLVTGDMSFHQGSGMDSAAGGRLVGYSPSYMAGYPYGSWCSLGRKGYELSMTFLPFGSPARRYYLAVVAMAILTPLLLGVAGTGCEFGWRGGVQVAAFGAAIYQLCDPVSFLWTFGNVAFPFASALGVCAAGLLGRPTFGRAALAGMISACAIWVHTIAAVPVAIGLLAMGVAARRAGISRSHLLACGVILLAIVVGMVLPGHLHYLFSLDLRAPMRVHPLPSGVRYLIMDFFNDRAYHNPHDRRTLFHLLVVLSSWQGMVDLKRREIMTTGLWLAGLFTLAFSYMAGMNQYLSELQPYRFVASADLFLAVPAAVGAKRLLAFVRQANPAGKSAIAIFGLILLPSLTGYLIDLTTRPRAGGLRSQEKEVVAWLASQPRGGRILCEPATLGNLLPHLTGRETIGGGISNQAVIPQQWATVEDGWAFGRPIGDLDPDAFLRICRLLDIRILIVESDELNRIVGIIPARRLAKFGTLSLYNLDLKPSSEIWLGCYSGEVAATQNRIRITNAPDGHFVLNYHFARGFVSPPGVSLTPVSVPGVYAPFLDVDNRSGGRTIELNYGARR